MSRIMRYRVGGANLLQIDTYEIVSQFAYGTVLSQG